MKLPFGLPVDEEAEAGDEAIAQMVAAFFGVQHDADAYARLFRDEDDSAYRTPPHLRGG